MAVQATGQQFFSIADRFAEEDSIFKELSEQKKTIEKNSSLQSICKLAGKIFAVSAVDFFTTSYARQLARYGFCLGHVVPKAAIPSLKWFTRHIIDITESLGDVLGAPEEGILRDALLPALTEGTVFHFLIQYCLLNKFPEYILSQISPELARQVNALPVQAMRVLFMTLLFASCHTGMLSCLAGGGISQLIGGLLYSGLMESGTANTADLISMHAIFNMLVPLMKGL